jgi:pimeloyl-ACP methyl ester carboxylesterase
MKTQTFNRPGGKIAYDDTGGTGPLLIAAPGMGDTRSVYRHLTPLLTDRYRVVTMDLRGLGESTAVWDDFNDTAVAEDYLALIDHLDAGPAILVGNSLSCSSAVLASVQSPDSVAGIVLLGPFVRPVEAAWWQKALFKVMLAPPWGRSIWTGYYKKNLYPGPKPADHDEHVQEIGTNLAEPRRMKAFRSLAGNTHAESGDVLSQVSTPTLVIMGSADPDFPDAVAEAQQIGDITGGSVVIAEGSGHYPQSDQPELVVEAIKQRL